MPKLESVKNEIWLTGPYFILNVKSNSSYSKLMSLTDPSEHPTATILTTGL